MIRIAPLALWQSHAWWSVSQEILKNMDTNDWSQTLMKKREVWTMYMLFLCYSFEMGVSCKGNIFVITVKSLI